MTLKLSRLPGKRLLTEMQHDQHDAAFMFSHSKEREAYFDYRCAAARRTHATV